MEKLRVFEAFAGYGSQSIALKNIGVPHKVVAISEIDKYAIQAYNIIHGDTLNLGDISKIKVESIPDHDLFTYSFPCQDISVAGKQAGLEKDSGTRSGLLWECEKIIAAKKPKYLLMENVKNLVGKQFKSDFDKWCEWLSEQGYKNFYKVLNAKDYGIPQNRERVFMVSILDENAAYEFPKPIALKNKLEGLLDNDVDKKYTIGSKRLDIITKNLGDVFADNFIIGSSQKNAFIGDTTISPTLTSAMAQGGGQTPMIKVHVDNTTKKDYTIRKLTPTECFRLMGVSNDDINKLIHSGISDTQLYKMAGNSIVVDVLEYIFEELFKE